MKREMSYSAPEAEILAPVLESTILDASVEVLPFTREDETDL